MTFFDIFSKKPLKKSLPLNITIDHREKNSLVISELTKLNFKLEFKQLPVADYLINGIAIERKTIADLKSSIVNKRIVQQLLELKQYTKHFLIIEGEQDHLYLPPLHPNATRGFLLAVALEFQTPIIFTQSPEDTAKYIHVLAKKKTTSDSIRPSKIFLTPKEQIQFILEGFPNIGPTKSKALIKKFKSLKLIFSATISELTPILGKQAQDFKTLIDRKSYK
jgi:ERCC4-type nuclease